MASIVDTAQVVDDFLANFGGRTVALRMHPPPIELVRWNGSDCQDPELGPCDPFNLEGDGSLLITSGYVISLISFLPLGLMDLKVSVPTFIFIQDFFLFYLYLNQRQYSTGKCFFADIVLYCYIGSLHTIYGIFHDAGIQF